MPRPSSEKSGAVRWRGVSEGPRGDHSGLKQPSYWLGGPGTGISRATATTKEPPSRMRFSAGGRI